MLEISTNLLASTSFIKKISIMKMQGTIYFILFQNVHPSLSLVALISIVQKAHYQFQLMHNNAISIHDIKCFDKHTAWYLFQEYSEIQFVLVIFCPLTLLIFFPDIFFIIIDLLLPYRHGGFQSVNAIFHCFKGFISMRTRDGNDHTCFSHIN